MLGYYPVRVLPSKTAILPVNPTFLPRVWITLWPFLVVLVSAILPSYQVHKIACHRDGSLMILTECSQKMSERCVPGQYTVQILIKR